MDKMHKKYTKDHAKLTEELAKLRKGRGLSPAKLEDKMAIRQVIANANNLSPNNATTSQIHSLFLAEIAKLPRSAPFTALRYAYCLIDDAKEASTLFQRRQELARLLHKHSDTIIRYENQAIEHFAILLKDLSHSPQDLPATTQPYAKQLDAQEKIIRQTATASLTGLLPIANYAPQLVAYLERSTRPYLDTTINIKFLPSRRGKDWYRLEVGYSFHGVRDTFRLAIVTRGEDGEHLIAEGLIDEFHMLNDHKDPQREIRTTINTTKFTAYNRDSNTRKSFRFHELSQAEAKTLLQSASQPPKDQCRFLEVSIPPEWQQENIRYEYQNAFNMRDDIHYAYWYAPSMMYLNKLTFDYSQFPLAPTWNFAVIPFLGNIAGESTRTPFSFTTHPNSWIMPGHGIALMWGDQ